MFLFYTLDFGSVSGSQVEITKGYIRSGWLLSLNRFPIDWQGPHHIE